MSIVHYCDICKEVLKRKVFFIGVQEYFMTEKTQPQNTDMMDARDFQNKINSIYSQQQKRIEVKEICPECAQVLKMLLDARLSKIIKLKEELHDMEKQFEE